MNSVVRNVLAVVAGLVVGGLVNTAIVATGPHIIAPPAGVNLGDPESLAASADLLEPRHFLFPFLAHAVGTFAGALLASLLAASRGAVLGLIVGVFFLAGGIAAAFMIPAPGWFVALDLVVAYLPMAWLGARVGRRLRPGALPATGTAAPA